jgi:hypothetical protein
LLPALSPHQRYETVARREAGEASVDIGPSYTSHYFARAVVASEQASATRASNITAMCFMVLSPSIHLFDVRQLPQIKTSHSLLGRGAETLMQIL